MEYVSPHYQYTLELLAGRLVTPERYGRVALHAVEAPLAEVIPLFSDEIPVENLRGLWD